jgi:hypothetical protein
MTTGDLAMRVLRAEGLTFTDFEPRGIPGFEPDIALKLGCSPNQTENLLRAVDVLDDDHHYVVKRQCVRERRRGSKGEVLPAEYRVTITPA